MLSSFHLESREQLSHCPPEQRLSLTPVLFLDNHKGFIHHFRKFFICHPPIPQTYSSGPSLGKASHVSFLDFINVLTNYYYGSKSSGLGSLSGQLLSHVWFFGPMDCSLPGSSVHGILQARILEWGAISYSRGSSQPWDRTCVSWVSCFGRQILYH